MRSPSPLAAATAALLALALTHPARGDEPAAAPAPAPRQTAELEEVGVTGERERAYAPGTSAAATKVDVPIRDVPQSIQVVSEELIRDRSATGLLIDLGRNVSGVMAAVPQPISNAPVFNMRGFNTFGAMLRDGYPRISDAADSDPVNIERIEFLKGPSSTLYGVQQSVAGTVNVVSKRPSREPRAELGLVGGGARFFRAAADLGGPLTGSKELLSRLTLAAESTHDVQDFKKHDSLFAGPAISWQLGPDDELTLRAELKRYHYVADFGLPAVPETLTRPRGLFWGEPSHDFGISITRELTAEVAHRFGGGWSAKLGASYTLLDVRFDNSAIGDRITDPVDPAFGKHPRDLFLDEHVRAEERSLVLDVTGRFRALGMAHALLVGASYYSFYQPFYGFLTATTTPFDPAAPGYGGPVTLTGASTDFFRLIESDVGVYLQDLVEVAPGWKVMLGARQDWARTRNSTNGVTDSEGKPSQISPRAGLSWQPGAATSVYASWGRSFWPQAGKLPGGGLPPPERGEQAEAGVKLDLLGGGLTVTAAVYQLTRRDVIQCNPADPACQTSIVVGEQRSRGVELDLGGKIGRHLRLTAAAALQRVEVTRDTTLRVGDHPAGAPSWTCNLFLVYELAAVLPGLELGGGLSATSRTEANSPNSGFRIPGNQRVDAFAAWRWSRHARIQVNVDNLTDHDNFTSSGFSIVRSSTPRAAYAQLQLAY
jgi:iron complex outermembrane receptor protein